MANKMKLLSIMMLALLLIIAACSGGGSGGSGSSGSSGGGSSGGGGGSSTSSSSTSTEENGEETINLSIMWWGPDARHEATLAALDEYTKQYPHVTFSPEYLAWDPFWAKLPTLVASNTVTDVLQMDAAYINEYVARGTLEDLSDLDLEGVVDPNIIENLKIDGKLYGIPLSHNAQGFAYNKVKLEEYGISLPQPGWTWDDYFSFAREARSKLPDDLYPIGFTGTWDGYQYYQTANGGGPIMQDEGRTFNLNKEMFMEFYQIHEELRKEGVLPPAEMQSAFVENDPQGDPLISGRVMTRGVSVGSVSVVEELMPGQAEVVNVPIGSTGKGGWAQSTIFLSVSANSPHKEEAKNFLRWFITNDEAGRILGLTRGIPINDDIYTQLEPNLQPKDIIGKKLSDVAIPYALPFYAAAAGYSEFIDFFANEMEAVNFERQTIEQAYENINNMGMQIAASK